MKRSYRCPMLRVYLHAIAIYKICSLDKGQLITFMIVEEEAWYAMKCNKNACHASVQSCEMQPKQPMTRSANQ